MAGKKPWEVPGVPWKTEASFWAWVRGVLRKGWEKHPVKLEYIKQNRKRIPNPKPSKRFPEVWGMTCSCCGKDTVQTNIEIDHISATGGTFRGIDDVKDYVEYLFMVDFSCLRAVCKPCHKIVTYAQRKGINFQEALLQKRVIEIMKKSKQEQLDFLAAHQYDGDLVSNADKRRALIEDILRKEIA